MLRDNPYHPLESPDDPTLFYNRQDAIAFLRQHLVGAHNKEMIVVLGRIGMGKTSLLHHAAYIVDERYQPVYIDANDASLQSSTAFLYHIVDSVVTRMEFIGASTYRLPEIPEDADEATLREWFGTDFLEVALTAIRRNRFLLLLIDDLHRVFAAIDDGRLSSDLVDYLGDLLVRHERLDIAVAIDGLHEERALVCATTSNLNLHFRLQPFDNETARRLITEPVEEHYSYTDESVERLLRLCGGYPFLIHSVCRLIFRLYEANPGLSLIGHDLIDHVYDAALEETGEVIQNYWAWMTPNVRAVANAFLHFYEENPAAPITQDDLRAQLTRMRANLNQTQLASALRTLEYDALIRANEGGTYQFSTGLEPEWLLSSQHDAEAVNVQPNRSRAGLVGMGAVIVVIALIGVLFAMGVFAGGGEAEPGQNDPPTATFDLDIGATQRALDQTATAFAIPSNTSTDTPTARPSDTPRPTRTSTATPSETPTRTPRPSRTPTDEPTAIPTEEPTRTPRSTSDDED